MSLRQILNDEIKNCGYVTIDRINQITSDLGYKQSNAERRLRKSESPSVEAVFNKNHIVGYKYKSNIVERFENLRKPKVINHQRSLI